MLTNGHVLQQRYSIQQILGTGGLGTVYLAHDRRLKCDVAVKEMSGISPSAAMIQQFENEATLLARLKHPHLPRVTDHFTESVRGNQGHYLVMEHIPGQSLHEMIDNNGPFSETQAVQCILPVLDALMYLHTQHPAIIHRDIKPANIRITPEGTIYLVDFGLAKLTEHNNRTVVGAQGFTAGFSPLEQYSGTGTDQRTDVYAIGATMYTLVVGAFPPDAPTRAAHDRLVDVDAVVTPRFKNVVLRCMALRPDDRYQRGADVVAALQPLASLGATQKISGGYVVPKIQQNPFYLQATVANPTPNPYLATSAVPYVKHVPLPAGHSTMFDSPFKSPTRAITDGATILGALSIFMPWVNREYGSYTLLNLIDAPVIGYKYEAWATLLALASLLCLVFIQKQIASTRTALARWKLLLGVIFTLPAVDIVITDLFRSDILHQPMIGVWLALICGIGIIVGAIGDIQSWWLPRAALEAGYAKIIHQIHRVTVTLLFLVGILTAINGYLSFSDLATSTILIAMLIIGIVASFKLPDRLIRP